MGDGNHLPWFDVEVAAEDEGLEPTVGSSSREGNSHGIWRRPERGFGEGREETEGWGVDIGDEEGPIRDETRVRRSGEPTKRDESGDGG